MRKFFKYLTVTPFPQILWLVFRELQRRLYASELDYGFEYDLTTHFPVPIPDIPVVIRELTTREVDIILNIHNGVMNFEELRERLERLLFHEAGIKTGYVAVTLDGAPCAICWLIWPKENQALKTFFRNRLPELQPDEVMLEYIYVAPAYRGLNLMHSLTCKLFALAAKEGARRAIAYVHSDNKRSLKASRIIGWRPFLVKRVNWRLFCCKTVFTEYREV
jgi:ribosomal protein S18 acetylase RimI-like enzyme